MDPLDLDLPIEETVIDFLLTADFAEVVNGKLYLMGAGWDLFAPAEYPAQMRLGIAMGIRVPFLRANLPHHFSVTLTKGDGGDVFRVEGDLETGRAAGSRGESTLVPFAANLATTLPEPQTLELVANVGQSTKRISIRAVEPPTAPRVIRG